jgi:HK97 family phage prohead protease
MDRDSQQLSDLILDPTQRDREPRQGQIGEVRGFVVPQSIDEEARTMRFACSSNQLDRYGEIVEPAAFQKWLPTFMANPVFVAGHVYIGNNGEATTIGRWTDLQVTDQGLEGTVQFMGDDDPLARQYWQRYSKGFQRAVSVGFITHAHEMQEREIEGVTQRVRVFTEVELVEISAVAIPANRESLVRAASATSAPGGAPESAAPAEHQQPSDGLQKTIQQTVKQEIQKCLDAGPGSPMATLFDQVVAAHQDGGGLGLGFEDDDDDLPPEGSGSDDPETLDASDLYLDGEDSGGDDVADLRLAFDDDDDNY